MARHSQKIRRKSLFHCLFPLKSFLFLLLYFCCTENQWINFCWKEKKSLQGQEQVFCLHTVQSVAVETTTTEKSCYFEVEGMRNEKCDLNLLNCSLSRTFYWMCPPLALVTSSAATAGHRSSQVIHGFVRNLASLALQHTKLEAITRVRIWGTGRPGFGVPEAGEVIFSWILLSVRGAPICWKMYGCCTCVCDS